MRQIALNWSAEAFWADLAADENGLIGDQDLRTDVIVSLFSWRRANDDDPLPDDTGNRMGWWGGEIGSRLWLLRREKLTTETINRAVEYCREALQHLIDDGAATDINVSVRRVGLSAISIAIDIFRTDGGQESHAFDYAWEEEFGVE